MGQYPPVLHPEPTCLYPTYSKELLAPSFLLVASFLLAPLATSFLLAPSFLLSPKSWHHFLGFCASFNRFMLLKRFLKFKLRLFLIFKKLILLQPQITK